MDIPNSWTFSATEPGPVLNRTMGKSDKELILEPYRKPWNLLFFTESGSLPSHSFGPVFNDLFPDDYFVKSLAAHRIQGLIGELRSTFSAHELKSEIQVQKSSYQMSLRQPIEYNRTDILFRSHKDYLIYLLRQRKDEKHLVAKQIQLEHHISRTLVLEVLEKMEEEKWIKKIPRGRVTIYQFVNARKKDS